MEIVHGALWLLFEISVPYIILTLKHWGIVTCEVALRFCALYLSISFAILMSFCQKNIGCLAPSVFLLGFFTFGPALSGFQVFFGTGWVVLMYGFLFFLLCHLGSFLWSLLCMLLCVRTVSDWSLNYYVLLWGQNFIRFVICSGSYKKRPMEHCHIFHLSRLYAIPTSVESLVIQELPVQHDNSV